MRIKFKKKKKKWFMIRSSGRGSLYERAQDHKPVIKSCLKFLRILLAIVTSSCKLAKFLVPILSPFTVNVLSVHDLFPFAY